MDHPKLDKYISSEGLVCQSCGKPLDTKTTTTMLCKACKGKEWAASQHAKFKEKYGIDNPMRDPNFVEKIQSTMLARYGAKSAISVPEFKDKIEKTNMSRYGVSYYVNSPECAKCSSSMSETNIRFAEFLKNNGIEILDTEVVYDNKRFDLAIKGKKLFIEVDPSYTHNAAGNHWDKGPQDKNKQLVKTLIAEKHGYRCIHVFDWDSREDILDLIRPVERKLNGRDCTAHEIPTKDAESFIEDNHIQRNCKGTTVSLGLYYGEELVQVMTFGKPRYNKNYRWELLRLCTKKGTEVRGGAGKLFKHATRDLKLTSIISYCDKSKFTGKVYSSIGMKLLRCTEPQVTWSKGTAKVTSSLLRQRGYDQLFNANYGKGTSNEELMLAHGWLPVYDCGQMVYTYGDPIGKDAEQPDSDSVDYFAVKEKVAKSNQLPERLCEFCNQPFIPASYQQRYCKGPHYMKCPVCNKEYLVTNNESLKRPPVACSYECRKVRREQTSLARYGIKTPGNNPEARAKTKETNLNKYGVENVFQLAEIRDKARSSMLDKYGVDNIQKYNNVAKEAHEKRNRDWQDKINRLMPFKPNYVKTVNKFQIDDDKMTVEVIPERESIEFLSKYGYNEGLTKFGKIHVSFGLVLDKEIYQLVRFERKSNGGMVLSDFGTRADYFNPNYYSKLIQYSTQVKRIESFTALIPRYVATDKVIASLSLRKIGETGYRTYWKTEAGNRLVTQRDNIEEMLKITEYFTTDYIDEYEFFTGVEGTDENL